MVQQSAWGLDGLSGAVPAHVMIAAQHHDGLVLGAFDGRKMVGILFGFTALDMAKPCHYSHITGVAKEYQSRGVGFKLKLAQRKFVMGRGMSLVKWTFDPLQAGNAFFNIGKLGGVCRTYVRNLYGNLNDSLNRGRLTDRFEVEWWVRSGRVRRRVEGRFGRLRVGDLLEQGASIVNRTERMTGGTRRPSGVRLGLKDSRLLVETPESIVGVRDVSLEASRDWTLCFRRVFEHYFSRGFVVTDVVLKREVDERRIFYLLESDFRL